MDTNKLDPSLLNLLHWDEELDLEGKTHPLVAPYEGDDAPLAFAEGDHGAAMLRPLSNPRITARAAPSTLVNLLIETDLEEGDEVPPIPGIHVGSYRDGFCTATLPKDQVGRLSEAPWVKHLHASHKSYPCVDLALPACNIPAWRSAHATHLDGRGVVVGVVDSGIDATHPAFAGRIHKIWDQTLSTSGGARYGRIFSGPHFAGTQDTHGHGTHVAGIAAGAGPRYGGVAPGATLLVVKTTYDNTHIIDAVRWIFDEAQALGMPAVVNLSLGGNQNPHDGTDGLSRAISARCGKGRLVCCAAGNEGAQDTHARVLVPPHGQASMAFLIPPGLQGAVSIQAWYDGRASLQTSVQDPFGAHAGPQNRVLLSTALDPNNQDHQVSILLGGRIVSSASGTWNIIFQNFSGSPVEVDAWISSTPGLSQARFTPQSAHASCKVVAPASARSAIAVASWSSRVAWSDAHGRPHASQERLGAISSFSSPGPLRARASNPKANLLKPDLAAPGSHIASAMSSHITPPPSPSHVLDPHHMLQQGTSMATPIVTGVVALLLQNYPNLIPSQAKRMLFQRCTIPHHNTASWDERWGRGLLCL